MLRQLARRNDSRCSLIRMLCCPHQLPRSTSRRLPGGGRRSLSRTAASITRSLARARGCGCEGSPRTAWPARTAAVCLPAKLLINTWRNATRYVPSNDTALAELPPAKLSRLDANVSRTLCQTFQVSSSPARSQAKYLNRFAKRSATLYSHAAAAPAPGARTWSGRPDADPRPDRPAPPSAALSPAKFRTPQRSRAASSCCALHCTEPRWSI